MQTLTLARYILEMSLMDYSVITLRDSHLASAALFMALRMTGVDNPWDKTLEYYSGKYNRRILEKMQKILIVRNFYRIQT